MRCAVGHNSMALCPIQLLQVYITSTSIGLYNDIFIIFHLSIVVELATWTSIIIIIVITGWMTRGSCSSRTRTFWRPPPKIPLIFSYKHVENIRKSTCLGWGSTVSSIVDDTEFCLSWNEYGRMNIVWCVRMSLYLVLQIGSNGQHDDIQLRHWELINGWSSMISRPTDRPTHKLDWSLVHCSG